jgi:integrase/recombinase XerC
MTTALASAQVISEYLRWMRARKLAQGTIKTARHILHGLARRAEVPILECGPDELREWQIIRAEELQPDTLRNHGSYVRGFFRWAIRQGYILTDPTDALELPASSRRLPRPIEEDELEAALESADDLIRAILCLAAFAGLRACEIAGLSWSEVRLAGREPVMRVTWTVGKGRVERLVDIAPPLADALAALPQRRGGPVIPRLDGGFGHNRATRVSQIANDYLKGRDLPHRLHSLRHRFASRVYEESGGDIRATQEALGHASPSTTATYARVARGSVRRAILGAGDLHPDHGEPEASTAPASR